MGDSGGLSAIFELRRQRVARKQWGVEAPGVVEAKPGRKPGDVAEKWKLRVDDPALYICWVLKMFEVCGLLEQICFLMCFEKVRISVASYFYHDSIDHNASVFSCV